ncbi:MAG: alpha/beta fold hydrolase [Isosphaeraceae bacterium]|nr:alpha/beta fold hydrolase [Isosphaeraceae bacterium]
MLGVLGYLTAGLLSVAAAAGEATESATHKRVPFGMHAQGSYRPNDADRPTVCLIHGMNSTGSCFRHLIGPLEAAGFGVVLYEYPDDQDLDRTAEDFQRDWVAFRRRQGETRPWAIVAHSMGGLVARAYVEGESYHGDVSDLILIAPPNRGATLARAQALRQGIQGLRVVHNGREAEALAVLGEGLGAAAEDLTPGSAFLERLNRRPRREGVRYHILAGDVGFLPERARRQIEEQFRAIAQRGGLLGGLTRLASGEIAALLDELTDGTGDGCVAVASTRLDGVDDHETIHANHIELIRGPSLYPEPGPVACMPFILSRLGASTAMGR